MSGKIPSDAFDFYISLGAARGYQAVADKYGVSKQAVLKCATRERWQPRLEQIEAKARESGDQKAVESIEQMNDRHLKVLAVVERKALEALRNFPLASAMDAVKALNMAMRQARLIRGEPTERVATNIEEIIRREYEVCMTTDDEEPDGSQSGPGTPEPNATQSGPAAQEAPHDDAAANEEEQHDEDDVEEDL